MKPIYKPKGAAAEYADYALNIYTGCPNGCTYCYAPRVLRKSREEFASSGALRKGLLPALSKQLSSGAYEGKTIHLCFTCDPYPTGRSSWPTRDAIKMLKEAGCHVQLLTKNPSRAQDDWDLLDSEDWIGTTFSGDDDQEPRSDAQEVRLWWLAEAKKDGFNTWVSCEPVLDPVEVLAMIEKADYIDLFKIGKLNHAKSYTDWASFGRDAEALCKRLGRNYVIKKDLRAEMEKGGVT